MASSGADGSPEAGSSSQAVAEPAPEPAKRLKKPVKPDKDAHKAAVDTLQEEMNRRRTRSEALRGQIDQRRQHGSSPEVVEARNKQNALTTSWRSEAVSPSHPPHSQQKFFSLHFCHFNCNSTSLNLDHVLRGDSEKDRILETVINSLFAIHPSTLCL